MRYLLLVLVLFSFNNGKAQDQIEKDTLYDFSSDSLHFHRVLDSVKILGFVDSASFIDLRLAAIIYMHRSMNAEAFPFLENAYTFNQNDTIVNTLLYESLIMKIHKQRNPAKNIKDISNLRKEFIHFKDSLILNEIIFRDALALLGASFDNEDLKTINNYYDIATKELNNNKNIGLLLNIPNAEIMFFNVALKNYLSKNMSKAKQVLKIGMKYFPENKDMQTLRQQIDKRSPT